MCISLQPKTNCIEPEGFSEVWFRRSLTALLRHLCVASFHKTPRAKSQNGTYKTHGPAFTSRGVQNCRDVASQRFESIHTIESQKSFFVENGEKWVDIRKVSLDVFVEFIYVVAEFLAISNTLEDIFTTGFSTQSNGNLC
jgi:hypothetical protein